VPLYYSKEKEKETQKKIKRKSREMLNPKIR